MSFSARPLSRVFAIPLLIGTLMTVVFASDFSEAGGERRWVKKAVTLALSRSLFDQNPSIKSATDVSGAARSASSVWSEAAAVTFRFVGTDVDSISGARSGGDGVSVVTVAATAENLALFPEQANSPPAYTRLFFDRQGAITEADVVLNPSVQFSTDRTPGTFDLGSVLLHEFGHVLGLGHSSARSAVMFERLPVNREMDGRPLSLDLSESDISAARSLYGPASELPDCCATVFGSIVSKPGTRFAVWAEDADSGLLLGLSEANGSSFQIGGLTSGRYRFLAQGTGGAVELAEREIELPLRLNRVRLGEQTAARIDLIGLNAELGSFPVVLARGRTYQLFIGGTGLAGGKVEFGFSTKHISVVRERTVPIDFGRQLEAVMITVSVDDNAPAGHYNIYAETSEGIRRYLIGAVKIATMPVE